MGLEPDTCDLGSLTVREKTSELGVDLASTLTLALLVANIRRDTREFDLAAYGTAPGGLTTITSPFAELGNGDRGTCYYNALAFVDGWIPVFRYTRTSMTGKVSVDVQAGAGLPAENFEVNVENDAEINLGSPDVFPTSFMAAGLIFDRLDNGQPIHDIPYDELPFNYNLTTDSDGSPAYIRSPTTSGVDADEWRQKFGYLDHNAASAGAQQFEASTQFHTGKFWCLATPFPGGTSPCDIIDKGGWEETGDYTNPLATDVELVTKPQDSTYILPIQVPNGVFVIDVSTECPVVTTNPKGGGGSVVTLSNRGDAQLKVRVTPSGGCLGGAAQFATIGGYGQAVFTTFQTCVDDVNVARDSGGGVYVLCESASLVASNEAAQQAIGQISTAYSDQIQKVVVEVTDATSLATTAIEQETLLILVEIAEEIMAGFTNATGLKIPQIHLDRITELELRAFNLTVNITETVKGVRTNADLNFTNTSEYFAKIDNLTADAEDNIDKMGLLIEKYRQDNIKAAENYLLLLNSSEAVKDALLNFGEALGNFTNATIKAFETIQEIFKDTNTGLIQDFFNALGDPDAVEDFFNGLAGFAEGAIRAITNGLLGPLAATAFMIMAPIAIGIALIAVGFAVYNYMQAKKGGGGVTINTSGGNNGYAPVRTTVA